VWPELGIHVVFLSVSGRDEVFVRVVLECHEGIGVARAHDPSFSPERTLLSLFVAPDFAADARALLADMAASADVEFHEAKEGWVEQVARELD
jgi:hypothetical protein